MYFISKEKYEVFKYLRQFKGSEVHMRLFRTDSARKTRVIKQ